MTGRLVLAGTPIGDARDASPCLGQVLASADVIAAEDTRRLRTLLRRLGVRSGAEVVSYFEGNETVRTPALVQAVSAGRAVVLVSDAGMPCVSDPGYRLVRACLEAGLAVTAVPGPSAVLTALALSGLPVDRFCFEGFLPRKPGPRRARLEELAREPRTMVFFEAPHRLAVMLADLVQAMGQDRAAAVCRELTKPYEEVVRGDLAELVAWAEAGVRGEVTVVVAGAGTEVVATTLGQAVELVRAATAAGERSTAAIARVASRTGLDRQELYRAVAAGGPVGGRTDGD